MNPDELCNHVRWAITEAHEGRSKLDEETLAIGGFSTPLQRRLMNNLCSRAEKYLEIGLFRGATICAAGCGNKDTLCVGVEDFSQPFGEDGVEEDLKKNLQRIRDKGGKNFLHQGDCWTVPDTAFGSPADVFMYDGEHSLESQSRALPHFFKHLADTSIVVVDDFSWPDVLNGTKAGLEILQNKMKVVCEWDYHVTGNDHPLYHNGLGIFVIQKV